MPSIPKIINFIWVGPKQPMDEKKLRVIQEWHDEVSSVSKDFEFVLWVDTKSANKSIEEIKAEYIKANPAFENVIIRDISTLKSADHYEGKIYDCARYEIDRVEPNYGAASDILRYIILAEYGGAYFDIDVNPGPDIELFAELFEKKFPVNVLFVDSRSQKPDFDGLDKLYTDFLRNYLILKQQRDYSTTVLKERLLAFLSKLDPNIPGTAKFVEQVTEILKEPNRKNLDSRIFNFLAERCSNDMLMANKDNPVMLHALGIVHHNYFILESDIKPEKKREMQIKYCYNGWNKMLWAISLTGPDVVRKAIFHGNPFPDMPALNTSVLFLRDSNHLFVRPQEAALSWMVRSKKKFSDPADLIQACLKDIEFELSHLGIFRLDDYLNFIKESLLANDINQRQADSVVKLFLSRAIDFFNEYNQRAAKTTHHSTQRPAKSSSKSGPTATSILMQNNFTNIDLISSYRPDFSYVSNPNDASTIISCLFLESDFTNGSIQLDFKQAADHPQSLDIWMENIKIAEKFVEKSDFYDIVAYMEHSTIGSFTQVRQIYARLEQLLLFTKRIFDLHHLLPMDFPKMIELEVIAKVFAAKIEVEVILLKGVIHDLLENPTLGTEEHRVATKLMNDVYRNFANSETSKILYQIMGRRIDLDFVAEIMPLKEKTAAILRRESREYDDSRASFMSEDFPLFFDDEQTESRSDSPSSQSSLSARPDGLIFSPRPESTTPTSMSPATSTTPSPSTSPSTTSTFLSTQTPSPIQITILPVESSDPKKSDLKKPDPKKKY